MALGINRRDFLTTSAAAGAGLMLAPRLDAAPWKTKLHKALIGKPEEETFKKWKAAGFEGMETTQWNVTPKEAGAAHKMADALDMRIHSVLFGWGNLNGGREAMADGVAKMETALRAAQAYGADTVLYVPCRIGGMAIPEAWKFDIRFDDKTGHIKQVVAGDNAKYQDYIDSHNQAVDASRQGVTRLIRTAEKTGVIIALENVWNNLWVKPDIFANFVSSFNSSSVRAYFDIGNHVKYAPPQDWIAALGTLIVKVHVKDFKLGPDGRGEGLSSFCDIREGSVDWPAVRKALDEVGYSGWLTIEGSKLSLAENNKRLDLIIAGK